MPTFSAMSTTSCAPSRRQRTRKAEADPYLQRSSRTQMLPGPRVLAMVLIRGPLMATVSRNGMTTTISGLTRSGKIGAVEIKATNTGIDVGRAIAEAPRRGTSRLVDLSSSEAGQFSLNVRCRTAEAVAFSDLIRLGD